MTRPVPARARSSALVIAGATAVIVTLAAAIATGADEGQEDPAAAWISHAASCLEGARSLEADFTQEVIHRLDGRSEIARGKLQIKRGKRLRLEYDTPRRALLVSDGSKVRAWDESARTLYESPARGTIVARAVAFALDGPGDGDFEIRWLGGAERPAPGVRGVVELRPAFDSPLASRIAVTLDGACPSLTRLTIVDRAGTATRLTLANQRLDRIIPDGRFAFDPPPGAAIVKP